MWDEDIIMNTRPAEMGEMKREGRREQFTKQSTMRHHLSSPPLFLISVSAAKQKLALSSPSPSPSPPTNIYIYIYIYIGAFLGGLHCDYAALTLSRCDV